MKNVILSIELPLREGCAKAALSIKLAEYGFRVYLMPDYLVPYLCLSNAVLVTKNEEQAKRIIGDKGNGFLIIDYQEEGTSTLRDEESRRSWVLKTAMRMAPYSRVHCVWGKWQEILHKSAGHLSCEIVGSIHVDICKREYASLLNRSTEKVLGNFTDFILINTRFCIVNNIDEKFDEIIGGSYFPAEDDRFSISDCRALIRDDLLGIAKFLKMVESISVAFPNKIFVLRPHPNESCKFYSQAFKDLNNVIVRNDGFVLHWIKRASMVITNGCTTALQAAAYGTPVIDYDSVNESTQATVFDGIGEKCSDATEIINAIQEFELRKASWKNRYNDFDELGTFSLEKRSLESLAEIVKSQADTLHDDGSYIEDEVFRLKVLLKCFVGRFRSRGNSTVNKVYKEFDILEDYLFDFRSISSIDVTWRNIANRCFIVQPTRSR